MTNAEIILTIVTLLLTAKELHRTFRHKWNKETEVKLAKIGHDDDDIKELKRNNQYLEGQVKLLSIKCSTIKVAFSMIYPYMEKLMKDDPTQKETLERLAKIIQED